MKKSRFSIVLFLLVAGCALTALRQLDGALFADEKKPGTGEKAGTGTQPAGAEKGGVPSEEELFKEESVVPSEKVNDNTIAAALEKRSLTFTGFLNSRTSVIYKRSSILRDLEIVDNNNFMSYFQSDFELDARLTKGIRGYANFSADFYPAGIPKSEIFQVPLAYLGLPGFFSKVDVPVAEKINTAYSLNEIFLDLNIARSVYFRIGRQVLKWGVGDLWTPTDLLNIEKKNILDSSQIRQGTYGLKMHIPFGTRANIYSFVDFYSAKNLSDISVANKFELLLENTEMSVSVLLKKKNVPIYGADFTSRVFGLDVHGEATLSYGDNTRRLRVYPWYLISSESGLPFQYLFLYQGDTAFVDYRRKGVWLPKASFGFGRGFEVLDVKDRIRVDVEGFYNSAGYSRNVFEKDVYTVGYFLSRGLYTPNYYGKYYVGMFIAISQMFVEELSAKINCIVNVQDQSSVISGTITYSPVYDLTLNLMVNGFVGKQNREYTVFGNYLTAELSAKIVF